MAIFQTIFENIDELVFIVIFVMTARLFTEKGPSQVTGR